MTPRTGLALIAMMALAACQQEKSNAPSVAGGQILEGSASDAMLPLDTVRSQAPLAPQAGPARATRSGIPALACSSVSIRPGRTARIDAQRSVTWRRDAKLRANRITPPTSGCASRARSAASSVRPATSSTTGPAGSVISGILEGWPG